MLSKISPLVLLSAAAAVAAAPAEASKAWVWDVTGFTSTCTAATCRYDFNVSAPSGPDKQPPVTATGCIGTSVQGEYKSCSTVGLDVPGDVKVQEFNAGRDVGAIISLRYSFLQDGATYTYEGNSTVAHTNGGGPIGFSVVPTRASAVA